MKKNIFLSILFFAFGFFTHAFFFSEVLSNGIADIIPNNLSTESLIGAPTPAQKESNAFLTNITFDGDRFSRHNITIEVGSYLVITNTSKEKLMWLLSNTPLLSTPRGYGESEQIRVRMDTRGQFVVADKNNPQEKLIITVK
jgi:hypothetical protein